MILTTVLAVEAAIEAAVKIGGTLGPAMLTLIEGHSETPEVQRQKATDAKSRAAADAVEQDAFYSRLKAEKAAGESTL